MNNLLIFTYGVSLEKWDKDGILSREIALYKNLSKKNVNFKFLTYGNENDLKYSNLLQNIDIVPVGNLLNFRIPKLHFLKSLLLPFKLKCIFKEIDIIKTNQIKGSWVACIAKIFFKKKIVIRGGYEWLNRHIILSKKKGIKNLIKYIINYVLIYINEFFAYKLADGIILTSKPDISFIIKCFKLNKKFNNNKICHFFNYIDVNLFKPLNSLKKDKHILFIGRLTAQKNLYSLLTAIEDLKEFALDLVGHGPLEKELLKRIKEREINVNFLGMFPNMDIPKLINQYQIFILPSYWEGNPKVLLEAMSCEVACIGSNIPGIKGVLKHKQNGYLCGTSSNSIRDAILTIYNDEKLRKKISKNARTFILDNCSLKTITNQEFLFYKEILKNDN